jgi:hypothetical protein
METCLYVLKKWHTFSLNFLLIFSTDGPVKEYILAMGQELLGGEGLLPQIYRPNFIAGSLRMTLQNE